MGSEKIVIRACCFVIAMLGASSSLPDGFVYLSEIDPTIVQEVMYYGDRNVIGARIDGYKAPIIILTEKAAKQLKQIQENISNDGYSLVIYDGYRPQKSLDHFVRWRDSDDERMKPYYYPYLTKKETFELGYMTPTSTHSRGSTVDLTIIKLGEKVTQNPSAIQRTLRDGRKINYWQDNTVDMFSSVDLLDPASWINTTIIDDIYQERRAYLRNKMKEFNFEPFELEWWHFKLKDEPFTEHFNFDIQINDDSGASHRQQGAAIIISLLVLNKVLFMYVCA